MKTDVRRSVDVRETDYCALNCRAGMITCMLTEQWGVDPAPLLLGLAIGSRDVLTPMAAGQIAGFTFGNVEDRTWAELFDARLERRRAESAAALTELLDDELGTGGLVLAAHDGFFDAAAADKFQRRHVLHNSLLYGLAPEGGYLVADRGYRYVATAEQVWQWMRPEMSSFTMLRRARPFDGDWTEQVRRGTAAMTAALSQRLGAAELAAVGAVVEADLADAVPAGPGERWQQTHAFLAGVGRSRALFVQGLAGAARAEPGLRATPELAAAFAEAADRWLVVSRWLYKRVQSGAPLPADQLARRVADAEAADRGALTVLQHGRLP